MKSFVFRCLLFASIQFAIGWVLISKGLEPAAEENAYLATVLDKKEMLTDVSEPRLILVGGSNVAFGFDTQLLGEQLQLKPVNYGLHAALGLFFPLNYVQEHVREGDVVVLSFEFAVVSSTSIDGNPAYIKEALNYWPAARQYSDNEFSWKRFMDREALDLLHTWVERGKRRLDNNKPQVIPTVYQRCNFNSFGDMIGHHGKEPDGVWRAGPVTINIEVLDRAIVRLNEFHAACLARGATVYYSSPPLPAERFQNHADSVRHLEKTFRDQMTIPIINSANEMVFAHADFYDTQYHLTKQAAAARSLKVADGVRRFETRKASRESTSLLR